ncbi:MAG: hypothetical protein LBQ66_08200 [Planctomycetaceae bacterium]|nr:hypothetical protein [Planctomycetaceae bacterium]
MEGLKEGEAVGLEKGRNEGLKEGRNEGRKEGRLTALTEVALTALRNGISEDQIQELTGLTKKEIRKIRDKHELH